MAPVNSGGAFAAVTAHFAQPQATEHLALGVSRQPGSEPMTLCPTQAKQALYGDQADASLAAPIWQAAIRAAQADATSGSPWQLLLIWLALPRLTGTVRRIATRLRVDPLDLESEMILAFLERLTTVHPDFPGAIDELARAARSSAWRFARSGSRSIPSADIEAAATRHGHPGTTVYGETDEQALEDLDLEILPLPGPAGLRAELRFTSRAERLEGERLGMLAGRLDLHDVVRQARRTGGRRRIGTLSLRPHGRRS
ncbi:hypothetical protein ADL22_30830 [Streptomyces sp. NRRL F-4489]|uniref:hypothetical protein n=1 Tax=Streptomyces sp. NRRL F-4489 TaxID=1609095 RepID=UPI00074A6E98|nr:hypothetical protein [Streptomyces sp. NRRL F-4489]KUL34164.1 hypothetical protein ADL22_30830 [Streptomyces sp. NRRL F-4489]